MPRLSSWLLSAGAGALCGVTACGTLLSTTDDDPPETSKDASAGRDGGPSSTDGGPDSDATVGDGGALDASADAARAKVVFVTGSRHTGALGGVDGGDAICNAEAAASGRTGAFIAYLQVKAGIHPADRLPDHAWSRVDGEPVFDANPRVLTPKRPLDVTADGGSLVAGEGAWTGVGGNITFYCGPSGPPPGPAWTITNPVGQVGYGDPSSTGVGWQSAGTRTDCNAPLHLYCFEQ